MKKIIKNLKYKGQLFLLELEKTYHNRHANVMYILYYLDNDYLPINELEYE